MHVFFFFNDFWLACASPPLIDVVTCWMCSLLFYLALDSSPTLLKMKAPTWTPALLKEAIQAVVTQKMRFTQASTQYGIPKGTLYDNILGKTNRMMVLEEAGLTFDEETAVLEFCCDISVSPYNRRTKKSLSSILSFVEGLRKDRDPDFAFTGLAGFRWWWAFCKKHSIVSLNYDKTTNHNNNNNNNTSNSPPPMKCKDQVQSPYFTASSLLDQIQSPYRTDKQINTGIESKPIYWNYKIVWRNQKLSLFFLLLRIKY